MLHTHTQKTRMKRSFWFIEMQNMFEKTMLARKTKQKALKDRLKEHVQILFYLLLLLLLILAFDKNASGRS